MAKDFVSFRAELDKLAQEVEKTSVEWQKKLLLDLTQGIVFGNPIGNPDGWKRNEGKKNPKAKGYTGGQSARNWRLTPTIDRSVRGGYGPSTASNEINAAIGAIVKPTSFWLSNPMPYIDRLEDGWSKQQPSGWILDVLQAVATKYNLRIT